MIPSTIRRTPGGSWSRLVIQDSGAAELESIGCWLPLDEVHRNPLRDP